MTSRMTTQRLARASRSRFFIGLAVLILTVGFVALFHSTQQELNQLHQMETRCEQQQQALNQQLSAFEQSANSERLEHQQTKHDLLRRTNEANELRDKSLQEANQKFGALQQSYKLLKIQNDDLVDECGKLRSVHLEQLGALETKLKNIAEQQQLTDGQQKTELDEAKVKVHQLEDRIVQLQQQLVNAQASPAQLRQQLADYATHCSWRPATTETIAAAIEKADTAGSIQQADHNFNGLHPIVPKRQPLQGREQPPTAVELTAAGQQQSPPTPTTTTTAAASAATTANLRPAASTPVKRRPLPAGVVPLSDVDDLIRLTGEQNQAAAAAASETSAAAATVAATGASSQETNQRYANVLANNGGTNAFDTVAVAAAIEHEEPAALAQKSDGADAGPLDAAAAEADNGAHEVMDTNVFLVDGHSIGHKDHMQLVLEDRKLGGGVGAETNNAAEDEDGGGVGGLMNASAVQLAQLDKEVNEEDNTILGGGGERKNKAAASGPAASARKRPSDPKLLHEIAADGGKVAGGYQDEGHFEEEAPEEEGDDEDEYSNLAARNMDPAIRN